MSDKIEEIRARHALSASWSNGYSDRATLLAEIERLRADFATQQGCCDGAAAQDGHIRREREEHKAEIEKLRAENERLRAALQAFACSCLLDGECRYLTARRALEGKP